LCGGEATKATEASLAPVSAKTLRGTDVASAQWRPRNRTTPAAFDEATAAMEMLSWEALDAFEEAVDEVCAASGRRFRVRRTTYWDMEPWASDLWIVVEARPIDRSTKRKRPYRKRTIRRGERLPH